MTNLKLAVQKAKVAGVMQQIAAITSYDAVAKDFNADGTVKTSLADDLEAFTTALAEKATSTEVTQDIKTACDELYNRLLGKADASTTIDEAYDTLKEIADWITTHGEAATTITSDIANLKTQIQNASEAINNIKSTEIEASEINGYVRVKGKDETEFKEIQVYVNPGANFFVVTTEQEAATAEASMKNGDILLQIAK